MDGAVDGDRAAGIGRVDAGEDLDQGRLARAVLADQAMHLARLDRPVDRVERDRAAEALADAGKRQERIRAGLWDWSSDRHSSLVISVAARARLRRTTAQPEASRIR